MQMTIRAELENYLKKSGITINQFAEVSGVNSGTISSIINGNRSIAVQQLDRITEGMGLAEGSFYELYVDECFYQSAPNWRRLGPLIFRCAELDKLDCIKQVVGMMMDNLSYAPVLFETAETLFKQDKHTAAAILYGSVAESEKYQHSERLALCQYRLFKIALCEDQEINLKAAVQFESFVNRLDEVDQLDALKDLANLYGSLRRMDKVEEMAKVMGHKAAILYKYRCEDRRREFSKEPTMPLFLYISYSNVLCTASYGARGDYDQALYYASLYADMSWVQEDTEEAKRIISQFEGWSIANRYLYLLMKGNLDVLQEYIAYIEQLEEEEELLPALYKIFQAANHYCWNVDDIILRFERNIEFFRRQHGGIGIYNPQVTNDRYARFIIELSLYYLAKKEYVLGIEYLLDGLEKSSIINSEACLIRCVGLFEQNRSKSSFEALQRYQNLISEVQRRNDKKNGFVIDNG
ncbi:XRE family transcriptional regulator [Paenibacillus anaericanus]|uniref:XRE family transcriptional regulator n=1 Tax=Paenibacillus anaericanus TaxID=170367 RepID=A0A433XVQ6_9BACL|nr:helix-turn-helix transcriptional regulator [Paenibacillus anaericanus]RUT38536.1 XRE family transcriptional regulator [Paenibacillus anaericanus]